MSVPAPVCSLPDEAPPGPAGMLIRAMFYPAVITICFACFGAWSPLALDLRVFLAICVGGALIALGEWWLPFKREWRGFGRDSWDDALYLVLVQQGLVRLAEGAWVWLWIKTLQAVPPAAPGAWAQLPLAAQFVLLLLIGEFGKYWVHRWSHEWPWLWRFHAVHHSVPRVYWFNVGRFHPLDKFLQMFSESLLFLALGAPREAIALYALFYAVNGFFQHANIDLRLGPLNRIISSAQQHRFHHSRAIAESNTNYGNKLSLYDQLFGTYYLPHGQGPLEYGLINRDYPKGFWAQLWAPFQAGLDQAGAPSGNPLWAWLLRRLIVARIRWKGGLAQRRLRRAQRDLRATQTRVLLAILAAQRETAFGRQHGFAAIRTIADFQCQVPVHGYEDLRPWIEQQEATGEPRLNHEPPRFYALTSGSTGQPKLIPVTGSAFAAYRRLQDLWLYHSLKLCPELFEGQYLAFVGAAEEGKLPSGRSFGSTSGHVYQTLPTLVRRAYVVPPEVFELHDAELKYLLILRLAIAEAGISFIGSVNPSTLVLVQELLNRHLAPLLADLEAGGFFRADALPAPLREALRGRLGPVPGRADQLRALARQDPTGALPLGQVWPNTRMVACWQGGGCRLAFAKLQGLFSASVVWREIGYLASEFRGTTPLSDGAVGGMPNLVDYVYEFVPVADWERGQPRFLLLDELETGQDYYLFVTTGYGLYRYHMNDIVRVSERPEGVPRLLFLQKGKGVTSITGEKLYEQQFLTAVVRLGEHTPAYRGIEALALADVEAAGYLVLVESGSLDETALARWAAALDGELAAINLEYAAKRDSGRLQPPRAIGVKEGCFAALRRFQAEHGQRESQVKLIHVQRREDLAFDWESWRLGKV
ncbi:MAG: GH3 auxin-responsive promoter family protein [Candidatus Sericytochromatia bacterium]|nr:GH3 auxin-responsive promoter family protein [Candidatus Sericytochromatia bacterium]